MGSIADVNPRDFKINHLHSLWFRVYSNSISLFNVLLDISLSINEWDLSASQFIC